MSWIDDHLEQARRDPHFRSMVVDRNHYIAELEALKSAQEALESIMLEGIIPDGFKLLRSQAEEALNKMDALGK